MFDHVSGPTWPAATTTDNLRNGGKHHWTNALLPMWISSPSTFTVSTVTHRPEAVVEVGGVEQSPGLPGLLQSREHHLVPQGRVEADYLLDVTEELGGFHLGQ